MMSSSDAAKNLLIASDILPRTNYSYDLLRTFYKQTARSLIKQEHPLPAKIYGKTACCKACTTSWRDGNFKIKVIPQRTNCLRSEKLVKALESGVTMSRKKRKRAKWCTKRITSFLKITCLMCKSESKVPIDKVKGKCKAKERTIDTSGTKQTNTTTNVPSKNSAKPHVGKIAKTKGNIGNKQNLSKKQNKKMKAKTQEPPPKPSLTSKKNTLLQLAHMLKAREKKEAKSNKLKMLLK